MSSIYRLVVLAAFSFHAGFAGAAERTLDEFKAYAQKRIPSFNDAQLSELAKLVDKNSDGKISDEEFAKRIEAFQSILKKGSTPKPKKKEEFKSTAKVVKIAPLTDSKQYDVLLITADELAKAWLPFATWKTKTGRNTRIVTVNDIAKRYEGDIIQEKIRKCVQEHITKHKTRWVILGGDSLPGGKGLVPGGHTTVHRQEPRGIPTDIVYLSKTDWDADKDGIYGEWKDDREAITYPTGKVGLGRIPLRTEQDIAAFTEKVIAYESKYPTNDFAKQMIYTCTDSPAYPKVRRSWDSYVSLVWGGKVGRFFSQETPWDEEGKPGSHDLSSDNLVSLLNSKKTGKLHIHGHGHLPAWVLERSTFTAKHVKQLKHDGAYPLMTTVSCNTGEYDSLKDPSIVELMLRQPKGGSVAIVAPVRTGKPHFHNPAVDFRLMVTEGKLDGTTMTMTRYWSNGLGGQVTTGQAIMMAKASLADDAVKSPNYHLCVCELNLLGDPTLDMRADTPRTPKLEAPKSITVGKQSIELVTDAPKSTVCLWKGKEVYAVKTADADGKVTLEVTPASPGTISVTVTGASLNTAMAEIKVAKK